MSDLQPTPPGAKKSLRVEEKRAPETADSAPAGVKIYDRPERTGPSPLLIAITLLIVLVLLYVLYRFVKH